MATPLAGLDVLIVDDELTLLNVIHKYLSKRGAAVTLATTRAQALTLLRERHFDVILCDFRIPGSEHGELALECVREYPDTGLLLTSGDAPPEQFSGLTFLSKPYRFEELEQAILLITRKRL